MEAAAKLRKTRLPLLETRYQQAGDTALSPLSLSPFASGLCSRYILSYRPAIYSPMLALCLVLSCSPPSTCCMLRLSCMHLSHLLHVASIMHPSH
jgi:hypothetical protein